MLNRLFPASKARPRPAKHRLNVTGPERLEARQVLSASAHPVELTLAITGTQMQFSPAGLPSSLAGDIYLDAVHAPFAGTIGKYEEVLTPILMDINGDAVPDFVGTTGVGTFTFFVSANAPQGLGSVTTTNVSQVQGVTAAGELMVSTVGTIVNATGVGKYLKGGFSSTSVVAMYPAFSMHTSATFELSRQAAKFVHVFVAAAGEHQRDAFDGDDNHHPGRHGRERLSLKPAARYRS